MWRKSKPYLLVLPATGVILLLFFGGFVEGLMQSLGYFPADGSNYFTFDTYRALLRSSDFWDSLVLTLRISILSTLLAGVVGLFVAICLYMLSQSGLLGLIRFWQRFFQLPLLVPHLVGAYLMVLLFMQSGWLSRILFDLGWIHQIRDFPVLINEPFGWGILFTYAWKEAPFIALMVYPVLMRIHSSWLDVARMFGAGNWAFAKEILIPLLIPTWSSAVFLVFAFSFSSFEVPFLLGVTYPKMLPVLSYDLYTGNELANRPEALAINVLLALITAILGYLAYRVSKRWSIGEGRGW